MKSLINSFSSLIPAIASVGILLSIGSMLGLGKFGGKKMDKKEIAQGVIELVCVAYEKEIEELRNKNWKLEEEIEKLKKEKEVSDKKKKKKK
ncbi:unnamed protein product [marine sediment metagenome]|uniref:Uncharacterized protein n=1 Tax=marine sediment metagenome TaxID=412755 RepID=X0STV0_9ZZZZ